MDVDTITKLISQVGFPIFVAVWLLWRDKEKMDKLTAVMERIATLIEKCTGPAKDV